VAGVREHPQARPRDFGRPRLAAGSARRETVVGAPAEERRGGDPREPAPEGRVVEVRIPAHPRDGRALPVLKGQRLHRLVGRRQGERRHRVVEDGGDDLGHVHPEDERVDPAVHLDADRVDEDQRAEPVRSHRRQLGGDPAAERGAHEVHAVEPELVEQIEVMERQVRDVLDPRSIRRAAVAGMARDVHGEAPGEKLLKRQPAPGAAPAVEEEQRGARAGGQELDRGPANGELAAFHRHQPMKRPPFGDSHCPVKNELSSDARKSAVAAISRGSPERPSGVRA